MSDKRNNLLLLTSIMAVGILILAVWLVRGSAGIDDTVAAYLETRGSHDTLTILYPLDGAVFPTEIPAPVFKWKDPSEANDWVVTLQLPDGIRINELVHVSEWKPSSAVWEQIRAAAVKAELDIAVIGIKRNAPRKAISAGTAGLKVSSDAVEAPLFYREVNLPFLDAVKDPSRIRWRFGTVGAGTLPPVVLDNLPVCGNCHSFSADGKLLGMDIDYANDKGSYAIADIEEDIILDREKVITWSDFRREDGEATFGLMSQLSPDGRFVVSTVKDRSVFVPQNNLEYSQLFFPVKGILAVYDRQERTFTALKGADDPQYVQSHPTWSPDGTTILFTRAKAHKLANDAGRVLLTPEECQEFLKGGKPFKFDIYQVPFNEGRGGEAIALKGASGNGKSNYFPKYTPNGKWVVFCQAANYSLLQPDSLLYIMPAAGGQPRRMNCNTGNMNSWHTISPDGKWMAFSSKQNGAFTQLWLTRLDEEGHDSPPVLLDHMSAPDRAVNIPEFVNAAPDAIARITEKFLDDYSFMRIAGIGSMTGDDHKEFAALSEALKLNPENYDAHNNMGLVMEGRGDIEQALVHLNKAIELKPERADAYNNLGIVLSSQDRVDDARSAFEQAIDLEPEAVSPRTNLGDLLNKQGDVKGAVKVYVQALKQEPANIQLLNKVGAILARQGKYGDAVGYYEKAIKAEPEDPDLYNNKGIVLGMWGKPDEALKAFERALKLNPRLAGAHNNMGIVLERQGKLKVAAAHYIEALNIDDKYEQARKNLNRLMSNPNFKR